MSRRRGHAGVRTTLRRRGGDGTALPGRRLRRRRLRRHGVAGPDPDPGRPRRRPWPQPAHPFSYATERLATGFSALGMSLVANPRAALSRPRDGRPSCNYCGNCTRGCSRLDESSADLTFIPRARDTGRCTFRTGAQVLRVLAGPDDRVRGVEYADVNGVLRAVEGRAVVMACGAIETPRLLLVSESRHAPQGLGNESGEVGRNLMETLTWTASALHPEPLGSHRGLPAEAICWDCNAPGSIPDVVGGCRFGPGQHESGFVGPVAYAERVAGGWGRDHRRRMRETFGRVLTVTAIGESLPGPGSFVDLDGDRPDAMRVPRARINSVLGESELVRLDFMARTCAAILDAAGAAAPFEAYGSYDAFQATHVFGTCRMGTDAETAVVDPWGRSHRWRNLYVADAGVFPSSGGGEAPALTIMALAIRTGRRIAESAAHGGL